MQIVTADQQLRATNTTSVSQGRFEQRVLSPQHRANTPVLPEQAAPQAQQALQRNRTDASADQPDEADTKQELEEKAFNAYQTVGMVKRILEQLSQRQIELYAVPAEVAAQPVQVNQPPQATNASEQSVQVMEWELGYQAVSARFNGQMVMDTGETIAWDIEFNMEYSWANFRMSEQRLDNLQDPLVISLNGMPAQLQGDSYSFDLFNTGVPVQLPNLAAQQFYLAYDKTGNGLIESGDELFGPKTGQGFAELAAHDLDGNGFIDQHDSLWQDLYLWRPDGQQLSMEQAQISAISVESVATAMPLFVHNTDELAGMLQRSSIFLDQQGQAGLVQQIDLVV
ncbi:MAG: hypothetical protein LAT66_04460 [Alkalimonas sp.]|nr:hypothetical protein [Alkalimonas sp.]